jgi:hypothetical protein
MRQRGHRPSHRGLPRWPALSLPEEDMAGESGLRRGEGPVADLLPDH